MSRDSGLLFWATLYTNAETAASQQAGRDEPDDIVANDILLTIRVLGWQ